jgi:hypothetical protein
LVSQLHKAALSRSTIDGHYTQAKRRAGITRRCGFHDLRHTVGSNAASKGIPLQFIQKATTTAVFKWRSGTHGRTMRLYRSFFVEGIASGPNHAFCAWIHVRSGGGSGSTASATAMGEC